MPGARRRDVLRFSDQLNGAGSTSLKRSVLLEATGAASSKGLESTPEYPVKAELEQPQSMPSPVERANGDVEFLGKRRAGVLRESPANDGDVELVRRVRRGDPGACEALCLKTFPAIAKTLRRVGPFARADREDLVQVTFERLIATVKQDRFEGACSLSTWASAIAGHVALSMLGASARERRLFASDSVRRSSSSRLAGADLERALQARAELRHLDGILSRMKPSQAATIVLHDVVGHELSEVANTMGVSEAAAKSRLVRGRRELVRRYRAAIANVGHER